MSGLRDLKVYVSSLVRFVRACNTARPLYLEPNMITICKIFLFG
jgi:hypothetical protein